jgi:hypothetical protein
MDVLLQETAVHPELLRYAAALGSQKADALEEELGPLEKILRDKTRHMLIALFFDGYNTRRAIRDEEIALAAKDQLSLDSLDDMMRDIKDYDPVLKRHYKGSTMLPQMRRLRREHPELDLYIHESARLYSDPLLEALQIPPGLSEHEEVVRKVRAHYAVTGFIGYIIRMELEKEIYRPPGLPPPAQPPGLPPPK